MSSAGDGYETDGPMKRPDHPDWERLRRLVVSLDEGADRGDRPFEEVLGEVIDPESATYMAIQRGVRLSAATGLSVEALATIWLDGLVVGAKFQEG